MEIPEKTAFEKTTDVVLPQLFQILDALLFASQKAITIKEFLAYFKGAAVAAPEGVAASFARVKESDLLKALEELREHLRGTGRSYELRETASGWQLVTVVTFAPWLKQMFPEAKPSRLSAPALETLAIIAYRQPMTRADIEAVRGVAVDGVMQTLLDRGFIRIDGRSELPGRPLLYATSQSFLDHFGLCDLNELPNAAELRYIPLPTAAAAAPLANQEAMNQSTEQETLPEPMSANETSTQSTEQEIN